MCVRRGSSLRRMRIESRSVYREGVCSWEREDRVCACVCVSWGGWSSVRRLKTESGVGFLG